MFRHSELFSVLWLSVILQLLPTIAANDFCGATQDNFCELADTNGIACNAKWSDVCPSIDNPYGAQANDAVLTEACPGPCPACVADMTWRDRRGYGCLWYNANAETCSDYDGFEVADALTPSQACCNCDFKAAEQGNPPGKYTDSLCDASIENFCPTAENLGIGCNVKWNQLCSNTIPFGSEYNGSPLSEACEDLCGSGVNDCAQYCNKCEGNPGGCEAGGCISSKKFNQNGQGSCEEFDINTDCADVVWSKFCPANKENEDCVFDSAKGTEVTNTEGVKADVSVPLAKATVGAGWSDETTTTNTQSESSLIRLGAGESFCVYEWGQRGADDKVISLGQRANFNCPTVGTCSNAATELFGISRVLFLLLAACVSLALF